MVASVPYVKATEPHLLLQNMEFLRKKLEMHMELLQIALVLSTAFQLQIQLTQVMPHLLIRVMVHHPRLQEMSTVLLQAMIASIMGLTFVVGSYAEETYLEEVVVTAQKRDENITEVPISITQLSGDRMNARFAGGGDIMELRSAVPGLHIESSNGRGAPRFYLRGLGNADFTAAASQPVTVIFDVVPVVLSTIRAFPIFVMESIEVARCLYQWFFLLKW